MVRVCPDIIIVVPVVLCFLLEYDLELEFSGILLYYFLSLFLVFQ